MNSCKFRIGQGIDIHKFGEGRPIVLGGVRLNSELRVEAHSDGDVLAHAIIDALLGALALGDIGHWFPDSDPQWKGADSLEMLKQVSKQITAKGWKVGNLDCSVLLETPKIAAYVPDLRAQIAASIGCEADDISIKATTAEKLGTIGRKEGIAAFCTVLLADTR